MRLLEAAVAIIRTKGLHATSVDDLCTAAGVTKGAFFHHFASKDELAVAAAAHWSVTTAAMFARHPYHQLDDPADRVLAYLDLRADLARDRAPEEFSCLVGTMSQEAFLTSPDVRAACGHSMRDHARTLEADLAAALAERNPALVDQAASLALYTQVVLQGAFVVAKATDDPTVVADAVGHVRSHLALLFSAPPNPHPSVDAPVDTTDHKEPTMSDANDPLAGLAPGAISVTPHLVIAGAAEAIEFYERAFDAVELMRLPGPDRKIMHACISVNGSPIMLVDENLEYGMKGPLTLGGSAVTLHLNVLDADAAAAKAEAAGATIAMPVAEQFWGDRYGVLVDPYGHQWAVATPRPGGPATNEELEEAMKAASPM